MEEQEVVMPTFNMALGAMMDTIDAMTRAIMASHVSKIGYPTQSSRRTRANVTENIIKLYGDLVKLDPKRDQQQYEKVLGQINVAVRYLVSVVKERA